MAAYIGEDDFATGCDTQIGPANLAQVTQLSASDTVRKAALQLAGRLPTANETSWAVAGDMNHALDSVLADAGFGDFVMRVFDDIYQNVGRNVDNQGIDTYSYDDNIAPDYCASAPLSKGKPVDRGCQVYWYDNNAPSGVPGVDDHDVTQRALTETGLQLVKYLATTGHDYRDILNANYMLLNPWSARSLSYNFSYDLLQAGHWRNVNDPNDFEPIVVDRQNWPTVGLLTDSGFMTTFSTTATNRNRKRAWFTYKNFLGLDILTLSQRPANLNALLAAAAADPNSPPPFMSNTACTDCHSLIDPMAGAWGAYNDNINFDSPTDDPAGPFGAYRMFASGFEGLTAPSSAKSRGPRWLAQQITADPRFARAMVTCWYRILTDRDPLGDPPATTTDINAYLAAQRYQDEVLSQITTSFVASHYNIQVAIKGIIQSVYYRGIELAPGLSASDQSMLGTTVGYRWTGPDLLNAKLLATTGTTWISNNCQFNGWGCLNQPIVREYEGLLGGIDPMAGMVLRGLAPTGLMVRISTTMASQVACQLVPTELSVTAASRKLLTQVDPSVKPDSAAHNQAIQAAIAGVYAQVAGPAGTDAANLADAFAIFQATYDSASTAVDTGFDGKCQHGAIKNDPTYTIKAWIAVMTYILSDPSLVME